MVSPNFLYPLAILCAVFTFVHADTNSTADVTTVLPISSFCIDDSTCASINLPSSTTDTFFQITSSTSHGWTGIGVGTGMAGAMIFVVYPSKDGTNVTVSPRVAEGHFEPAVNPDFKVTILAGSGISGDKMTVNFRCANCRSWSGGKLDTSSTEQPFIWATGEAKGSIMSDSPNEQITQHSSNGFFVLDIKNALGGDGTLNPFVNNIKTIQLSSSQSSAGGSSYTPPVSKTNRIIIAHGVIMSITWVILFPLGAAFIRLLNNRLPNPLALHRGLQGANTVLAIIGLVLGVSIGDEYVNNYASFHKFLGITVVVLLFIQGGLGQLHHSVYLKTGKRSQWSYAHIWFGRTVISLGIINGGFGLKIVSASSGQIAAYTIVALLVVSVYSVFYFLVQRKLRLGT